MAQHLDGADDGIGYGVKGESSIPVVKGAPPPVVPPPPAIGVWGDAPGGVGVSGTSNVGLGVEGTNNNSRGFIAGTTDNAHFRIHSGVFGESDNLGVYGSTTAQGGTGVYGNGGPSGFGMRADSGPSRGFVAGTTDAAHFTLHAGVFGESDNLGVYGSTTGQGGTGVYGSGGPSGFGMRADSGPSRGFVAGTTDAAHFALHAGVFGESDNTGVYGQTTLKDGTGVYGNGGPDGYGVRADCTNGKAAILASSSGTGLAGYFHGDVEVTGDIRLVNADCAEDFAICKPELVEPGTVMVINPDGALQASQKAYDKCVAGVISGAGDLKPGIILGKQESQANRMPIALIGKVYCKVDAQYAPIEVGDLLTTSPTPGHAMKVCDPTRALGTLIGKALSRLDAGQGLIPILVALQ